MPDPVVPQDPPAGTQATQVNPADAQPENNQATTVVEEAPPQPGETQPPAPGAETSPEQAAGMRLKGERDAAVKELEEVKAKQAYLEQERGREANARPPETETTEQRKQRFQDDGLSYVDAGFQAIRDENNAQREWDKLMAAPASRKDPQYAERMRGIVKKFRLNTGDHARDAHFASLEYDKQFGSQLPNDPATAIEKSALGGAPSGGGSPAPTKSKREQARELYASGKYDEAIKMNKEAKKEEGDD